MNEGAEGEPRPVVLVVDDEPANRAVIRGFLGSGYEVVEAEDGPRALELLERVAVDLVLLDVMMPLMSGLEVCRKIKSTPRAVFLPVVLVTALGASEDRHEGLAAGADEFLTKPVDFRELLLRVRGLLTIRGQGERIRRQVSILQEKESIIRCQLEELQQLHVLKDDLFSLLIHDLRNPLSGVLGFLELLVQEHLARPELTEARDVADRALASARKLQVSLEEVLEVARLESGSFELHRAPTPLERVAHEAVGAVEGAARLKRIAIEVSVPAELVVTADGKLVRRALENLLVNAIKFSPRGERIVIAATTDERRVLVEVIDRGPGIADSTKLKLFKKFAAVELADAGEQRHGFGLGLHLVKLVANAHGGDVSVRDNAAGGSVFGLSLARGDA